VCVVSCPDKVTYDRLRLYQALLDADAAKPYLAALERTAVAGVLAGADSRAPTRKALVGSAITAAYRQPHCAPYLEAAVTEATTGWRPWLDHRMFWEGYQGSVPCPRCADGELRRTEGRAECPKCGVAWHTDGA
jgi:hypothetical protein